MTRSSTPLPTPFDSPHPWTRLQGGLLGLVIAVGLCLGWLGRSAEISTGGDEATYIQLSESLRSGHYRDEYILGAPLHAHYPPGMPAWLLAVRSLPGDDLDVPRAANLLLLGLAALLLADGLRRIGYGWAGIGAAAVFLWNPLLLEIGATLHSEALYIVLSLLATWASLRSRDRPGPGWPAVAGAAAAAGFLTRSVGLGLLAGIGVAALAARRWRFASGLAVAGGAVVAGWFLYLRSAIPQTVANTYVADVALVAQSGAGLVDRVMNSLRVYLGQVLPDLLELPMASGTMVDNLATLLILGGLGLWGWVILWRRWAAGAATVAAGAGILMLWVWPVDRLMLPLLPWLAATLMIGAAAIGRRLPSPLSRGLPLAVALVLAGLALRAAVPQAVRAMQCEWPDQYAGPGCVAEEERAFVAAVRQLNEVLPPGAVISSAKPSTTWYFARRSVVPVEILRNSPRLEPSSSGVLHPSGFTHLLLTPFTTLERNLIAPILRDHCAQLGLVHQAELGALVLGPRGPGAADACAELADFQERFPPRDN